MQETLSHDAILREVLKDLEAVTARVRQLLTPEPRRKKFIYGFNPDGSYNLHYEEEPSRG
jgi:hypothetical protein